MKVFAVAVNPDDLKKTKGATLKNFPIPMPQNDLERITAYCKSQGVGRCEWARRVLLASFDQTEGHDKTA